MTEKEIIIVGSVLYCIVIIIVLSLPWLCDYFFLRERGKLNKYTERKLTNMRIEKLDSILGCVYIIQQRHFIFRWWWIDADKNYLRFLSPFRDSTYLTFEEANLSIPSYIKNTNKNWYMEEYHQE